MPSLDNAGASFFVVWYLIFGLAPLVKLLAPRYVADEWQYEINRSPLASTSINDCCPTLPASSSWSPTMSMLICGVEQSIDGTSVRHLKRRSPVPRVEKCSGDFRDEFINEKGINEMNFRSETGICCPVAFQSVPTSSLPSRRQATSVTPLLQFQTHLHLSASVPHIYLLPSHITCCVQRHQAIHFSHSSKKILLCHHQYPIVSRGGHIPVWNKYHIREVVVN